MNKLILIVDDMEEARKLLRDYLSIEGYTVISARNGIEALNAYETCKPDLIICDIMMPQMGGFELVNKIRQQYPTDEVPIIMLSAKDKSVTESVATSLRVNKILQKPTDLTELSRAIESLLNLVEPLDKVKWVGD